MLAIKIIFFTVLGIFLALAGFYFMSDYVRKPKMSYICFTTCFVCIVIVLISNNTLTKQNQRIYHREETLELIKIDTLCFENGNIYQRNYFGDIDLVQESSEGFYRCHTLHTSREIPVIITPIVLNASETEIIETRDCRQPTLKEYLINKTLINPEGEICWECSETKYVLTLPPNAIKKVDSFKGS